jgi:surface protein
MFRNCTSLIELDLSSFDTSNVINMSDMFYFCNSLISINFGNSFNTSKVTNMGNMFYYCYSLTTLDLSSFDTSGANNMSQMFYFCNNLTSIIFGSKFDTTKVLNMGSMFYYCYNLTTLDLSGFNVNNVTSMANMFYNCYALTNLNPPRNIRVSLSFENSENLTYDSLIAIINNLAEVQAAVTLTLSSTNINRLSIEDIAIASRKGWTVN